MFTFQLLRFYILLGPGAKFIRGPQRVFLILHKWKIEENSSKKFKSYHIYSAFQRSRQFRRFEDDQRKWMFLSHIILQNLLLIPQLSSSSHRFCQHQSIQKIQNPNTLLCSGFGKCKNFDGLFDKTEKNTGNLRIIILNSLLQMVRRLKEIGSFTFHHNSQLFVWRLFGRLKEKERSYGLEGFDDWKHFSRALQGHERSKSHLLIYRQRVKKDRSIDSFFLFETSAQYNESKGKAKGLIKKLPRFANIFMLGLWKEVLSQLNWVNVTL